MKSVIGVVTHKEDVESVVQELREAGFAEDRISILNTQNAVRQILNCQPYCEVPRHAFLGTAIGMAAYATSAILASWCQCNLFGYERAYGTGTFLGGILAGAFIGGFLGIILGIAQSEGDSHLYVQGVRMGGKLISIEAREEEIESIKHILKQASALGVKALY
jgi:hypothetical protein